MEHHFKYPFTAMLAQVQMCFLAWWHVAEHVTIVLETNDRLFVASFAGNECFTIEGESAV